MQPARQTSSRSLLMISGAVIGGIIIGGVGALGVAMALIEPPPPHDAPAGSAVFDGQPHVVQQTPTPTTSQIAAASPSSQTAVASQAPAVTPPGVSSPVAPQPIKPVETQATPPAQQQTPAQVLDKTWPDAPAPRPPRATETIAAAPAPASKAPETVAAIPAPKPTVSNVASKGQTASTVANSGQTVTTRTTPSHNPSRDATASNVDTAKPRVVVIPDDAQQPRADDVDTASIGPPPRPLFDFFGAFGNGPQRDDRDIANVPPPPQPRASRNPRDPQLVIRHRQESDDDDAANASPPPQYGSQNNFFGFSRDDNWQN
jgi:hypothetical protein